MMIPLVDAPTIGKCHLYIVHILCRCFGLITLTAATCQSCCCYCCHKHDVYYLHNRITVSFIELNDSTHFTPYRQGNDDAVSCFVNSRSQTITKFGCYPIFYPKTAYDEILRQQFHRHADIVLALQASPFGMPSGHCSGARGYLIC